MLALRQPSRGFSSPVDIFFKSSKLAKTMNEGAALTKAYGANNGKALRLRLAVLAAAASLADVPRVPPERCHRLVGGKYKDCFAVDGVHPFRLIFEATHPPPKKRDGGLALSKITAITILEVVDYH